MRLEHVGIAVGEIKEALASYEALLGSAPYKQEVVDSESVSTHFFWSEGVKIELLESLAPDSPVARFIDRRGPGLHHLAFSVADLEKTRDRLLDHGFEMVGEAITKGADGKRIFFIHPRSTQGVLVECCQSDPSSEHSGAPSSLPSGVQSYTAGHPIGRKSLILEFDYAGDLPLGPGLVKCVEPLGVVTWVPPSHAANLSKEDLVELAGTERPRLLTIGIDRGEMMGKSRLIGQYSDLFESWVHIKIATEEAELNNSTRSFGDDHVSFRIVIAGENTIPSAANAVIPWQSVNLDAPEFDSLVPLIRSFWNSEQDRD